MKDFYLLFLYFGFLSILACGDSDNSGGESGHFKALSLGPNDCPEGFIPAPSFTNYTTKDFCVAKYEMKNDGAGNAVSQALKPPWVNINRPDAIAKCKAMGQGVDLITNDEWQTLARNIELVGSNWDGGKVGFGIGLNHGHSTGNQAQALEASSDDNDACFNANGDCDGNTWHHQRRTNFLSNKEVIWDLGGNAHEWVKDDNVANYGINQVSMLVLHLLHDTFREDKNRGEQRSVPDRFGPAGNYPGMSKLRYQGGFGWGFLVLNGGAVIRGGSAYTTLSPSNRQSSGIFTADLNYKPIHKWIVLGFRCTYHP